MLELLTKTENEALEGVEEHRQSESNRGLGMLEVLSAKAAQQSLLENAEELVRAVRRLHKELSQREAGAFRCKHANESCPLCVQRALDAEEAVAFVRNEMATVRRLADEADKRYKDSLAVERKGYAWLNNELFKMKQELEQTRRKLAEVEVERDRRGQYMRPDEWKGVVGCVEDGQRALLNEGAHIGVARRTLESLVRLAQSRAADYKRARALEQTVYYERAKYDKLRERYDALKNAWAAGWPKLKDALQTLAFRIPDRPIMSSHASLDATLPITIWDAHEKASKAWLRLERMMGKPD